jgi:isoleucyl-tRNA synthetase
MDYKNTLNLPRTDFPMKADLVTREPERLKKWDESKLYQRIQTQRASCKRFVLHDGPPFANGEVHIGTALNKLLKDFIVKGKSLRGFQAPYIPGWDCHGLPIEFKVTQDLRKAGADSKAPAGPETDAATIRTACDAYARKYIDLQRTQFRRLGVFGDWERPYLTLNKEYEAAELRLFADIVEKGFVYRGKKPVYWSIPCRTALAEAEVEYKDHVSQSIYVKFPVIGRPATSVVIWTTTPWTLPANLTVAYNSKFAYSLVQHENETYIVSSMLLSTVAEKCGWLGYQIVRTLTDEDLAQLEYHHPFCERTGKLYAGDAFVDNVTGSGFVHIAPGHGLEDYNLGLEHGLPIYSPVDDDGRFARMPELPAEQQMPEEMLGKSILEKHGKSDANEAVLHQLRLKKALLHQENYHHSYPHCWRSKTPIIFRAMDQWFIRIDHREGGPGSQTFRERALAAIAGVQWVPDWGRNRIEAAVAGRPDWCISRQRSWGVPIPAFYDAAGQPILEPRIVRKAADLFEQHGSNVWFEKSAAELWSLLKPEGWQAPDPIRKSADTLDVWIDSGSSSRAVVADRVEIRGAALPFQVDMYIEGSDQHRGWFQSSLLLSLAGNGAAPYKTVLTHGFMVDADREKISKSKQGQGGYEKPQTSEAYIKKWGADVVRLWVSSQDFRNDVTVSDERLNTVAEIYRVLRNALRYQLSNLFDFDPAVNTVPPEKLTGLDRWILGEFAKLEAEVLAAYDDYLFHVVYQKISQFVAVELSALYHDVVKDRLYTHSANSHKRRSTQTTLHRLVAGLCELLSPILAFTSDEAWEYIPGAPTGSVHERSRDQQPFERTEKEIGLWKGLFKFREELLPMLEVRRQAKVIGKSLEAKVRVIQGANDTAAALLKDPVTLEDFRELLNVSQVEIVADPKAELVVHADGQKCERCWHWELDVGSNAAHPTICARCVEAVQGAAVVAG